MSSHICLMSVRIHTWARWIARWRVKVMAVFIVTISSLFVLWFLCSTYSFFICASQVCCGLFSLEIMSRDWCRKASSAGVSGFPWYDALDEHCSSLETNRLVSIYKNISAWRVGWWWATGRHINGNLLNVEISRIMLSLFSHGWLKMILKLPLTQ